MFALLIVSYDGSMKLNLYHTFKGGFEKQTSLQKIIKGEFFSNTLLLLKEGKLFGTVFTTSYKRYFLG